MMSLDEEQGGSEARTEVYETYIEGALELPMQLFAKTLAELPAPLASRPA